MTHRRRHEGETLEGVDRGDGLRFRLVELERVLGCRIDRLSLHVDLTILARLASALSDARAVPLAA